MERMKPAPALASAFILDPPSMKTSAEMPSSGDGEIFGRPEGERDFRQRRPEDHQPNDSDRAGDERPDGADGQRRPRRGPAWPSRNHRR